MLAGDDALELIDKAVSRWVGIVVLNGGEASGGKVYEAACKLKSVVRDRAYLLVSERVDIAAAANASGVILSDQGFSFILKFYFVVGSELLSVCSNSVSMCVYSTALALGK